MAFSLYHLFALNKVVPGGRRADLIGSSVICHLHFVWNNLYLLGEEIERKVFACDRRNRENAKNFEKASCIKYI